MEIRKYGEATRKGETQSEQTNTKSSTNTAQPTGLAATSDVLEKAAANTNLLEAAMNESVSPDVAVPVNPSDEKAAAVFMLKEMGMGAVLTEEEINEGATDKKKLKGLLDLVSAGQLTGANEDTIQRGKDRYLKNPTNEELQNAAFDIVADTQGVPSENARAAGIKTAADLLGLQANLALLGDDDAAAKVKDPKIYEQIKKNGVNSVYRDTLINTQGLPENARNAKLTSILNALAAAQETGADSSKPQFWEKVKKEGVQSVYRDNLVNKRGLPDVARNLTLDEVKKGIKEAKGDKSKLKDPAYWQGIADRKGKDSNQGASGGNRVGPGGGDTPFKDGKRKGVGSIIHSDRRVDTPNRRESAKSGFNPLHYGDTDKRPATTNKQHQQNNTSNTSPRQSTTTERPSHADRTWGNKPGGTPRTGGTNSGSTTGTATTGSGQPNAPTHGSNPTGGAANDFGSGEGAAHQTGVGISADSGKTAGGGAVYTVIDGGPNEDGSITYYWSASGAGVREGLYKTTYTQNSDGTWSYETTTAFGDEVVASGEGDPPDESIIGTSTQDTEDDYMIFPTDDDDTGDEGKPLPYFNNSRPTVVNTSDWRWIAKEKGRDANVDPSPIENQGRTPLPPWVQPKDKSGGYTDPVDDFANSRNIFASPKFKRSDGYTDPSPEGGGSRGPAEEPKPRPSRAKGTRNMRNQHQPHGGPGRTRRR